MRFQVIAVGTRMPAWVQTAVDDYSKRMPAELKLHWREVKTEARARNGNIDRCLSREAQRIGAALPDQGHLVLLDEHGKTRSTRQLAQRLSHWQQLGQPVSLVIGGPDGVDDSIKARAHETLAISALTLPHPIVRVVLAEQIYRAWSILANHPYHRE